MKEETRKYLSDEMGGVHDAFKTIDLYDPRLVDALASLRKEVLPGKDEKHAIQLSQKYRELIMVAIEASTGRGEKGVSHARKAIRAGASPKEIFETLALCIYLVGMSSWVDSGHDCLLAAEDEESKVRRHEDFRWKASNKRPRNRRS